MPLPELQTNNADFGNTLLKIRTMQQQDEQNRILNQNRADTNTRENALMVYKKKREEAEAIKAEAESKKAWRENAGTRVASLAVQPDGDMLNNYKVMYEADKEKNEYGLLPLESYINDKREIDVKAVREYLNRTAGVFLGKPGTKADHLIRNDKADLSKPDSIDNPYALKVTGMIGENGLFTPSAIEPAINPFRKQAQEEKVQNANIKHQEGTLAVSKGNLAVSEGNLKLSQDEKKNPKLESGMVNNVGKQLVSKFYSTLITPGMNETERSKLDAGLKDPITGSIDEAKLRSMLHPDRQKDFDIIKMQSEQNAKTMTPAEAVNEAIAKHYGKRSGATATTKNQSSGNKGTPPQGYILDPQGRKVGGKPAYLSPDGKKVWTE